MALPKPVLDDRTFDQLVEEARARIPRFTPEWTNFNESDPGVTLLQLHAWLTETILYRLNQLPDLNYIKFLELLNVQPQPARAARAQLTFKLKKLNDPSIDPLVVLIPKNTQVKVDDPELTQELIFETDRTLTALNAVLPVVIVPGEGSLPRDVVTEFDAARVEVKVPLPFYPFGKTPAVGNTCLLGLLLRPYRQKNKDYSLDRFPAGELDLTAFVPQVFEIDAAGQTISGPKALECLFPWQATAASQDIVWECYRGTQHATQFEQNGAWQALGTLDETASLARSGHIYLDVPGGLPVVTFAQLSRDFWSQLGLFKPPTTVPELAADIISTGDFTLDPAQLEKSVWEDLGLSGQPLADLCALLADPSADPQDIADLLLANAGSIDFTKVDATVWTDVGYSEPPVTLGLTWFRARLLKLPEDAPEVSEFRLNTVAATAAVTRIEEILGGSNGRPNQVFALSRQPVLIDPSTQQPDLAIVVTEAAQATETWRAVGDFYGVGPGDAVYLIDSQAGTVTFGDGVHGRIPGAGAEIRATRYRAGGGRLGNVGAGTISALKSALPNVDSVSNLRAAAGGADAEPLSEVMLRAPHDLRTGDRAVTADDFAELARRTPDVRIQRAYALPLTRVDTSQQPPKLESNVAGAVTVVILPENKEDTPQPSEDQLRLVCAHLNRKRLITTELYVIGPSYRAIDKLHLEITVDRQYDLKAVHEAVTARLLGYFHPLRGGEDGRGWPFGQDIHFSTIYRQVLGIAGVRQVLCLSITPVGIPTECPNDVLDVPDGMLVSLPRTAIDLKVTYDPNG